MKSRVKVKQKPNLKRLDKLNKTLSKGMEVVVGLPKNSNPYPDGTSVIMVGTVHEFGSPRQGIPQRSFLRSTMKAKRRSYKGVFKKLAKQVVSGKKNLRQVYNTLGGLVQGDVFDTISRMKTPPLKSRKGGDPLQDTGHLIQSITYEVRDS